MSQYAKSSFCKVSRGLHAKYGDKRVIDTPITEVTIGRWEEMNLTTDLASEYSVKVYDHVSWSGFM